MADQYDNWKEFRSSSGFYLKLIRAIRYGISDPDRPKIVHKLCVTDVTHLIEDEKWDRLLPQNPQIMRLRYLLMKS